MSEKPYREFLYEAQEDYDKKVKINDDDLLAYSKKKLKKLYPDGDYEILGETFEKKKRDKQHDIGRIELNEKRLYISENGDHSRLFKKQGAFVAVSGGGFIALLKTRLLPIFLLLVFLLVGISGGIYAIFFADQGGDNPGIRPIDPTVLTISGTVTAGDELLENAVLSLQYGNQTVATATTDKSGKYLINNVQNANYNLVCTYGESSLTKVASVDGKSIEINFDFGAAAGVDTAVNAIVKITDDKTPPISVGGLSEEAVQNAIVGQKMDLTLLATELEEDVVPTEDKAEIEVLSGDLEMTYFDFSVLKEIFKNSVLETSEYLKKTGNVLEIAIPYDSSRSVATYAFRRHDGVAVKLEALESKPADGYRDGTYYVTSDTVYIYTNLFSTYAIGSANTDQVVRGSDTITYSNQATVNLKTKKIELLYRHDADSTNDAKIQIYLIGESGDLLIAESDTIPVGYQIESMDLLSGIKNMPSVGTYEGLMKIVYLGGAGGAASTNVDIPLVVAITQ